MKEKIKSFILQNWFKIVISIGVILIGCYFVIYLPKENRIQDNLANQIRCQQEGNEKYDKDVKIEEERIGRIKYFYSNPEFKFNEKMGTCLYKVEKHELINISNGYVNSTMEIVDIYTNKDILIWSQSWDGENERWTDVKSTEKEWDEKYRELFL
jgi:hypothetical protein